MNAKLYFDLSKIGTAAHIAEHGDLPPQEKGREQAFYLPVGAAEFMALTKEQRAAIVAVGALRNGDLAASLPKALSVRLAYGKPKLAEDVAGLNAAPATAAEWLVQAGVILAQNKATAAEYDQAMAAWLTGVKLPEAIAKLAEGAERCEQSHCAISQGDLDEAKRLGVDLGGFNAALTAFKAAALVGKQRTEAAAAELAARNAAAEAAKQQRHADKLAWVADHGSDHLRRAVERGHDCTALYVRERVAVEAPGFVCDIYDGATWKAATCPSVEALNEADAAEKLGLGDVEIVWLTSPATDTKTAREDAYWAGDEPHQDCLAVVIRGYLGKYDLVKALQ